jgi:hypothetical protein
MSRVEHELDDLMDAGLRALGPAIPEPRASAEARARIAALLDAAPANAAAMPAGQGSGTRGRWLRSSGVFGVRRITPYVSLGLAATALWLAFLLNDVRAENTRLKREVGRLNEILTSADTSESIRYIVVNLHSDLCPRANVVTPAFAQLMSRHSNDPVAFVTLDVTGQRSQAQALAQLLNIDACVFENPCGSETGIVKVIDRKEHKVLLTATCCDQIKRVEELIADQCSTSHKPIK